MDMFQFIWGFLIGIGVGALIALIWAQRFNIQKYQYKRQGISFVQ